MSERSSCGLRTSPKSTIRRDKQTDEIMDMNLYTGRAASQVPHAGTDDGRRVSNCCFGPAFDSAFTHGLGYVWRPELPAPQRTA